VASAGPAKKKDSKAPSVKTDIVLAIREEHMNNIAKGIKNHEYRKYLINKDIQRMWFYVTAPVSAVTYIAVISRGKAVGEVEDEVGLGNAEFNAGLKVSKFGYEIKELYKVTVDLSSANLKKEYSVAPPMRYTYIPQVLFDAVPWAEQEKVI